MFVFFLFLLTSLQKVLRNCLSSRYYSDGLLLWNSPRDAQAAFLSMDQAEIRLRTKAQLASARKPTQVGVGH